MPAENSLLIDRDLQRDWAEQAAARRCGNGMICFAVICVMLGVSGTVGFGLVAQHSGHDGSGAPTDPREEKYCVAASVSLVIAILGMMAMIAASSDAMVQKISGLLCLFQSPENNTSAPINHLQQP